MFYFLLFFIQDTLSQAYSDKWLAQQQIQESNRLTSLLASHELAFVVFGVVLIVLTVIFTYLFRLDKKVTALELKLGLKQSNSTSN
jgi:hypothetical protein